ncbi:MAG: nitrilase-related carbon-nitrogen hydrolase [Moraxella sp.]|nr:nitrilase-related carbon-nitrogen hydrolase [Moraxella sp.]
MTIRIASIQLNSQTDIDANLATIKRAISDAAPHADLIVLPENMCVMGRQSGLAERFDEMCDALSDLAKTHQVHLLAGTLPCRVRADGTPVPDGKYRQTSLIFDDTGRQIARYDKTHLFRATVNDSTGSYDEGKTFEAGDELIVAPLTIQGETIHLGMMICFDVRFPIMAQRLRALGADIISVPAAFTYKTGEAHWRLLLQARALDSQCMMIGSTQGGTHHIGSSSRETWGHAMMVNAHGQVVADSRQSEAGETGYAIIYGEFDKAEQERIRQSMPIFGCHRLN